jgi:glucose/arabinose dehydrogenase
MRNTLLTAAGVSVALVALSSATIPADATGHHGRPAVKGAPFRVVADGLNNPRQLNFSKGGKLYIAESGTGGTQDCRPGPEAGDVCWGPSGSVTVVAKGHQRRVVKGLPSYADETVGTAALGPADVVPYGHGKLAISIGYGFDPADRAALAKPGNRFGQLVKFDLSTHKLRKLGDLAAFEGAHNPIHDPNTDPTGVFKWRRTFYVTDSGANDLVKVRKGKVRLVKVFHDLKTSAGKVQAVPTDVVVGPDKALYICELTGFPFVKGAARIYRMVPGHKARVYASGLTNLVSMAFGKDGKLYAVQISNQGLASPAGPTGSLWRIASDKSGKKSKNLTGPLFAPYGVAIRGHNAYVTTGAVINAGIPPTGQVIKVPLS